VLSAACLCTSSRDYYSGD